jgi:hypothetical protein
MNKDASMAKKTTNALPLDDDPGDEDNAAAKQDDDGLDCPPDTTTTKPAEQPSTPPARQGDQHRPYCMRHNVLMSAYSSRDGVTRYRCPVPGCDATEKRAQPTSNIPREPHVCPHCAARAKEAAEDTDEAVAPPVYLESDWSRSTYAMIAMVCPTPGCRFSVRLPRPDISARSRRMRGRAEKIGER